MLPPPVKKIVAAVGHLLQQERIWAVLLVPVWESTSYWCELQRDRRLQAAIVDVRDVRPRFLTFNAAPGSVFARQPRMQMWAFLLKIGKKF